MKEIKQFLEDCIKYDTHFLCPQTSLSWDVHGNTMNIEQVNDRFWVVFTSQEDKKGWDTEVALR